MASNGMWAAGGAWDGMGEPSLTSPSPASAAPDALGNHAAILSPGGTAGCRVRVSHYPSYGNQHGRLVRPCVSLCVVSGQRLVRVASARAGGWLPPNPIRAPVPPPGTRYARGFRLALFAVLCRKNGPWARRIAVAPRNSSRLWKHTATSFSRRSGHFAAAQKFSAAYLLFFPFGNLHACGDVIGVFLDWGKREVFRNV